MGTTQTFFHDRWNITLWVLVLMCGACVRCLAAGHFLEWDVHDMFWSPDGVEDSVMAINGQFPGPTIAATAGDEVHVRLRNKLTTEGVVIHWHGIRQKGTPWADGTASISQCVINPGETFDYNFTVDRAGTYFYHGHYGMQRSAGLYGSLVVKEAKKEPLDHYDDDFSLLLSDWWHESVHHQELGLSSNPFRWIGEPQTILINGRGQYNCSFDAHTNTSPLNKCNLTKAREEHWDPYVLNVHPNKSYRLRIASVTSLASLNMAIGGHKMWVVEADGNYVQPFETDDLDIYSGQSYSILFKTNQEPTKNYWISFGVRGRKPATPQGLAIVSYNQNPQLPLPASPPPVTPRWDDYDHSRAFSNKIRGLKGVTPKVPEKSDRRIFLLNTQNEINGYKKWAINNISLTLPPTPYLGSIRFRLGGYDKSPPPENFPADYDVMKPPKNRNTSTGNGVYMLGYRSVVDIILQNANALSENVSEIHPWHLHGHDFWVLGYGEGKFKEGLDDKKFNLENPPYKNTEIIFPYGWTALRFVADNPGVWAFHCHIEPHLHMGMGVIFAEGMTHLAKIPKQGLACGLAGKKFMKNSHFGG